MDGCAGLNMRADKGHSIGLVHCNSSERAPPALPSYDNRLSLAGLVLWQAPVRLLRLLVLGAHMAAEKRSVNLDNTRQLRVGQLRANRLANFVEHDERGFVLHA